MLRATGVPSDDGGRHRLVGGPQPAGVDDRQPPRARRASRPGPRHPDPPRSTGGHPAGPPGPRRGGPGHCIRIRRREARPTSPPPGAPVPSRPASGQPKAPTVISGRGTSVGADTPAVAGSPREQRAQHDEEGAAGTGSAPGAARCGSGHGDGTRAGASRLRARPRRSPRGTCRRSEGRWACVVCLWRRRCGPAGLGSIRGTSGRAEVRRRCVVCSSRFGWR